MARGPCLEAVRVRAEGELEAGGRVRRDCSEEVGLLGENGDGSLQAFLEEGLVRGGQV